MSSAPTFDPVCFCWDKILHIVSEISEIQALLAILVEIG